VDGDIDISNLTVEGEVDVDTLGEYRLTYSVSDEVGNETVIIRVVSVTIEDEFSEFIFQDTEELVDGTFTTTDSIPSEVQDANNADITDPGERKQHSQWKKARSISILRL